MKDFLDELLEKNSDLEVVWLSPREDFTNFWNFNTPIPLSESFFSLGVKTFFAKGN